MSVKDCDRSDFDAVIRRHVWRLVGIGSCLGAVVMVVIFSAYHFGGLSYFCGSCHSMENNYYAWKVSRHKQFACVECHLPRDNPVHAVAYKAYAGIRDVSGETLRTYPFVIKLTAHARTIANSNCRRCHFSTIENTPMASGGAECMKCHRFLVHGRPMEQGGNRFE
jgi:cytochrome c nitrite reductase small subunit